MNFSRGFFFLKYLFYSVPVSSLKECGGLDIFFFKSKTSDHKDTVTMAALLLCMTGATVNCQHFTQSVSLLPTQMERC